MARLEIGRTLDDEKARAEARLDEAFAALARNAVFYLRKTQEARRHLAGEPSDLIVKEAGLRGVEPDALAAQINALAEADDERELARVAAKQHIRQAKSKTEIATILAEFGL